MRNLKNIINSDEAYEILDQSKCGGTWTEGGCSVLASALKKINPSFNKVVIFNLTLNQIEHFGVETSRGTILDGDGEHSSEGAWLRFFKENEHVNGELEVMPYNSAMPRPGVLDDDQASSKLANLIKGKMNKSVVKKLIRETIEETIELKNISDDDEYWDRVKIIVKNKSGKEVGYAILDMLIEPEHEFVFAPDEGKYSDEEIEQHFPDDFISKLEHLEVLPEFRQKGNGKKLMDAVVNYVKKRGVNTLFLIASPIGFEPKISLDNLSKFYSSYGFKVIKDYGNAHDMVAQLNESVVRKIIKETIEEAVIDETYTGQKDLEKFANDILIFMGERIVKERERNEWLDPNNAELKYLPLLFTGKMTGEDFGEIEDFIKSTSIKIVPAELIGNKEETQGRLLYGRPDKENREFFEISLKYSKYDLAKINELFEEKEKVSKKDVYFNLYYMFFSTLLHELQHAYDAWRSEGKAFNSAYNEKYIDRQKRAREISMAVPVEEQTPEEIEAIGNSYKEYQNLVHEINARFAQAMHKVRLVGMSDDWTTYEKNPWKDVYSQFKTYFEGWRRLSDKMQKKLTRRLAKAYQEAIDMEHGKSTEFKKEVAEGIDKLDVAVPNVEILARKIAKKIGAKKIAPAENGNYGYAFLTDDNRVIKITSDKSELVAANKIKGKRNKHIVDVYDSYKIKNKDIYVLVVERVDRDDRFDDLEYDLNNFFLSPNGIDGEYGDYFTFLEELDRPGIIDNRDINYIRKKITNSELNKDYLWFFNQMLELIAEIRTFGITTYDYGANNVGMKKGNIALFDLGMGKY